ncbi:MAG: hypothetical protein GF364_05555 [Candidatus Lokiarchaeota archaeon]|nr:hypothetical protein [Candidatus Lokiarchaeota archaeon]
MKINELKRNKIYVLKKYCRKNKFDESVKYVKLIDPPMFLTYPEKLEKGFPLDCIKREATEYEIRSLLNRLL